MHLAPLDWIIIGLSFFLYLFVGLVLRRQSGQDSESYFLGGRNMPWWLLGVSMVATTFSADTPNLVTDIVRKDGVSGNWAWWAFLLTGMLTVFVYAKLWRRSGITTDLEFYELRYSGPEAKFLRAFRALYLGVFFNVMIMATVLLAGIKLSAILLGLNATQTVLIVGVITVAYSSMGGLKGVILTDFIQFAVAMIGMIWACIYVVNLPEIGGLEALLSHEQVRQNTSFLPDFNDTEKLIPLLIVPLAVQWWSVWYPGAEPGGGGYIAQRMLSAKDEKGAIKATLLFNLAHYALRPWPWILIALASIVVFPSLSDISSRFPHINPNLVNDDLAFPAMLSLLPKGLLGIVITALIAALMSTLSTHLNWGSSYIVNDFYVRFIRPNASNSAQVTTGRVSTVLLMVLAGIFALYLQNALQAFNILLQIGAGTGLLFILRWFWWRINAISELIAMTVSFAVALYMEMIVKDELPGHEKLLIGVGITTLSWLAATFISRPTNSKTLLSFYQLIRPWAGGWQPVIKAGMQSGQLRQEEITTGGLVISIVMMLAGVTMVYALLFSAGFFIYSNKTSGYIGLGIAFTCMLFLNRLWKRL
jgi:solute:Na+ symporter, SSS family